MGMAKKHISHPHFFLYIYDFFTQKSLYFLKKALSLCTNKLGYRLELRCRVVVNN